MIEKKSIFHLSEYAYQKQFSSSEHKIPNFIRNQIYDVILFYFCKMTNLNLELFLTMAISKKKENRDKLPWKF